MRNYWLRILFGAVAIFAVGMVGLMLARQGMGRVRGVVEGSGPITVPIAFLPFKLDGEKLGTIQRLRINRRAPNQVRSVEIRVRLADSVSPARLEPCILVAEGFERFNSETTVACRAAEDTARDSLAEVGQITLTNNGNRSFRLFMPRDAIRELTDSNFMFVGEDSAAIREERRADSIAEATERRTDSIIQTKRPALESLGVEVPRRNPARKTPHRMADSARTR